MVALPPSIRIGASTTIEVQTDEGAREFKSRIEDIQNSLLHVAMPSERGQLVVVPTGQYVTLSVMTPTGTNMFIEGEVMGRRTQPFPVLVIRPMSVESNQQRNFHRVQLRMEPMALWQWTGTDDPDRKGIRPGAEPSGSNGDAGVWQRVTGTILDVSGGGIGLLADSDIPKDSILRVKFPLPVSGEPIELRGRVMISRPRPQGSETKYQSGVQFEEMSPFDQDRLVRAIHQYQLEERRRSRGL